MAVRKCKETPYKRHGVHNLGGLYAQTSACLAYPFSCSRSGGRCKWKFSKAKWQVLYRLKHHLAELEMCN